VYSTADVSVNGADLAEKPAASVAERTCKDYSPQLRHFVEAVCRKLGKTGLFHKKMINLAVC
jgi:hypothetical protein